MARPEVTGKKTTQQSVADDKATPIRGPPTPAAWYTIRTFCEAHKLSQAMYFKLKGEGRGPREIAVGSRRFITFEAAADWRAAREAETSAALSSTTNDATNIESAITT